MSEQSQRTRRQFSTEQKVAILRRHLVDKVPVWAPHRGVLLSHRWYLATQEVGGDSPTGTGVSPEKPAASLSSGQHFAALQK